MAEEAKYLETARADRSVWLMKCPPVVSRAWQAASASSSDPNNANPVVAKVVLSLDLLRPEEPPEGRPEEPALQVISNPPQSSPPRWSLPRASAVDSRISSIELMAIVKIPVFA